MSVHTPRPNPHFITEHRNPLHYFPHIKHMRNDTNKTHTLDAFTPAVFSSSVNYCGVIIFAHLIVQLTTNFSTQENSASTLLEITF